MGGPANPPPSRSLWANSCQQKAASGRPRDCVWLMSHSTLFTTLRSTCKEPPQTTSCGVLLETTTARAWSSRPTNSQWTRLLHENPHVLIFDEPTNYLDREGLG